MPTRIGVPTAPNVTGVLWMMRVHITAASAGKPSASSSGPATAAGVPKPDAPSMNAPNIQATMISWTRRSRETFMKPWRIDAAAPLSERVCSRRMAPKMIHSSETAMMTPRSEAAATWTGATSQRKSANAAVIT